MDIDLVQFSTFTFLLEMLSGKTATSFQLECCVLVFSKLLFSA